MYHKPHKDFRAALASALLFVRENLTGETITVILNNTDCLCKDSAIEALNGVGTTIQTATATFVAKYVQP